MIGEEEASLILSRIKVSVPLAGPLQRLPQLKLLIRRVLDSLLVSLINSLSTVPQLVLMDVREASQMLELPMLERAVKNLKVATHTLLDRNLADTTVNP